MSAIDPTENHAPALGAREAHGTPPGRPRSTPRGALPFVPQGVVSARRASSSGSRRRDIPSRSAPGDPFESRPIPRETGAAARPTVEDDVLCVLGSLRKRKQP